MPRQKQRKKENKDMKYIGVLLAVSDLERSKHFYQELFDQTVTLDLGWNVTFSGGFIIQLNFDQLTNIPKDQIITKPNNMELYFEVDDFDAFVEKLRVYPGIEYVNEPMECDWKQRIVRIYDPDDHIIEIGESMQIIAKRYLAKGYSLEETAALIQHPVDFVKTWL